MQEWAAVHQNPIDVQTKAKTLLVAHIAQPGRREHPPLGSNTLVIVGKKDPFYEDAIEGAELMKQTTGAQVKVKEIEGAGHLINRDARAINLILSFVKEMMKSN